MPAEENYPKEKISSAKYMSASELTAILAMLIELRETTQSNKIFQRVSTIIADLTKR